MRTRTFVGNGHHGLEAFIHHLTVAQRGIERSNANCLDAAAKLIEKDAKDQIGHYQAQVGPFPAWAPLSPAYEAEKVRAGGKANAPLLMTGALKDSIQRTVGDREAVVGSTDEVMVYHEFGTSKMPPRPVLGPAVFKNRRAIEQILGDHILSGILGGDPSESGGYFG